MLTDFAVFLAVYAVAGVVSVGCYKWWEKDGLYDPFFAFIVGLLWPVFIPGGILFELVVPALSNCRYLPWNMIARALTWLEKRGERSKTE